jgi:CarD family transcriptional regulator
VEGSASEAVNGAPADPALPTGKGDLGVAEAPEADATAGAESATTIDVPPPAEAATTPEATAAAAQAEDQPPADAPAEPAAESGTETTAKEQAEAGTEAAAEPAAKPKPGTPKATQGKTKAGAKPAKKAPAKKAAAEAGAATGAKTRAKAAAEDDAPPAAKPAAKAATRPRSRSAAKPDAKADGKPDATADGKAPAAKSKSAKSTRKSTRKRRLQYKVGQQLVYPLQGVGQIRNIEERPFRNQTLLYYVVYLEVSDMTIMVPVEKADELGIRAIVPRTEGTGALRLIGEDYEPIPTDWKLRYQMNLDLLKAGSVSDIATVVRALYHRSRIKELPILERKLYDNARSLLVDELSFSLGKDKGTIEEMINSRLQAGVKA